MVVPKAYRERLGLRPGQELQLDETDAGLLLTPVVDDAQVVDTKHGPVIVPGGSDPGGVLTDEAVRDLLEAGRP